MDCEEVIKSINVRESRHWPCYCSFSHKYKLQNDENFQWQYCGEYCCIASSIGIVLNDRICEKSQINVRPVIALFRATIHLSLVQSVLESLLLLGMIGDVEQSKAVNICLVWMEKYQKNSNLTSFLKNIRRIAKAISLLLVSYYLLVY